MDPLRSVRGIRSKELRMLHKHLQSTCMTRWSRVGVAVLDLRLNPQRWSIAHDM
jgi:hypothetical protein